MTQTRWDPFEGMGSLRREINRLLEDFLEGSAFQEKKAAGFEPVVEVYDKPAAVVVRLQVPGVHRDDLQLTINGGTLMVQGELKLPEGADESNVSQREFRYGTFSRTVALPAAVGTAQPIAQLKDGILTITIPKNTKQDAQSIPIQE